jgi:hypothetical protein
MDKSTTRLPEPPSMPMPIMADSPLTVGSTDDRTYLMHDLVRVWVLDYQDHGAQARLCEATESKRDSRHSSATPGDVGLRCAADSEEAAA